MFEYYGEWVYRDGTALAGDHADVWGYNDRNELTGSQRYNTFDPNSPGSPSDPNHAFDRAYEYDPIGSRKNYTEGDPNDPNYPETTYIRNCLNQYTMTINPVETFTYDDEVQVALPRLTDERNVSVRLRLDGADSPRGVEIERPPVPGEPPEGARILLRQREVIYAKCDMFHGICLEVFGRLRACADPQKLRPAWMAYAGTLTNRCPRGRW